MTPFDEHSSESSQTRVTTPTDDLTATTQTTSETIKESATQKLNASRASAADEIDHLAQAARTAAADLDDQQRENLSHYVSDLADNISALAQSLRKKSVDELVHDLEKLAREHPALFIGGSIALGLGIARFAKASNQTPQPRATEATDTFPSTDTSLQSEYSRYSTNYNAATTPMPPVSNANGQSQSNPSTYGGSQYE